MHKGILVDILRPARGPDCTLGGATAAPAVIAILVGRDVAQVFEPMVGQPVLELRYKDVRSPYLPGRSAAKHPYLYAVPVDSPPGDFMFGGNFIFTSDSRFPNWYPIPVHDRRETTHP